MELTRDVDAAAASPVVVFGSLPPAGRDLDIVVRDDELEASAAKLRERGYEQRGWTFVKLQGCDAGAIDISRLRSFGLPDEQQESLFREARPLPDHTNVCVPSAAHTLLILARRVARSGGRLDAKRRRRIDHELAERPDAWETAASVAPGWGAQIALAGLRAAYERGRPADVARRANAIAEELRTRELSAPRLRAVRTLAKRAGKGAVVSLSGLDGSGKTTQAEALRESLERLGYDTVIEWTKIARNPSLSTLSRAGKRILARRSGASSTSPARVTSGVVEKPREKTALLTHTWATIVSATNAWSHRRVTSAHTKHGRIVVCDRYVLDTAAHLRYRYGRDHYFRAQTLLNRLISPRPVCAFLLDVSPAEALRRKHEQYDLEQLTLLASLYRSEAERLGVKRLDGDRSTEELCEEIARAVWERLAGR